MRLKIFRFEAMHNHFDMYPDSMNAWVLEEDWNKILADYPIYKEGAKDFFVKIECHEDFSDFTIYTTLSVLPNTSVFQREGKGLIWLPDEIRPDGDNTTNKKSEVEVSIVECNDIPLAESLTIKVDEDEVEKWSEEEFAEAQRYLRRQLKLCCSQQKLFFNLSIRDAVVASIINVTEKPKSKHSPFWISSETKLTIEGKPLVHNKTINFSMIGGQEKAINELRRMIQLPLNYPEYFDKFDIKPSRGVLLYGPPGNGKTMIARAVAQSFGAAFIEIDLTDALQKYKGVGEYNIGKKFDEAEKRRNAVIFIDEIDSIASIREIDSAKHEISLVGKLLSLMDGIKSKHRVFVIGATNRLYAIDPALRRPGRFDKELEIPQPDSNGRYDILKKYIHLEKSGLFDSSINDSFIQELAEKSEDFSGADLSALYTEAVMIAINKQLALNSDGMALMNKTVDDIVLTCDDFTQALLKIKPSIQRSQESEKQRKSLKDGKI